jgi:hypothetical protein
MINRPIRLLLAAMAVTGTMATGATTRPATNPSTALPAAMPSVSTDGWGERVALLLKPALSAPPPVRMATPLATRPAATTRPAPLVMGKPLLPKMEVDPKPHAPKKDRKLVERFGAPADLPPLAPTTQHAMLPRMPEGPRLAVIPTPLPPIRVPYAYSKMHARASLSAPALSSPPILNADGSSQMPIIPPVQRETLGGVYDAPDLVPSAMPAMPTLPDDDEPVEDASTPSRPPMPSGDAK